MDGPRAPPHCNAHGELADELRCAQRRRQRAASQCGRVEQERQPACMAVSHHDSHQSPAWRPALNRWRRMALLRLSRAPSQRPSSRLIPGLSAMPMSCTSSLWAAGPEVSGAGNTVPEPALSLTVCPPLSTPRAGPVLLASTTLFSPRLAAGNLRLLFAVSILLLPYSSCSAI
jgi:hypothetical protein